MLRIASSTRSRNFGRTVAVSLITCDTVPIETWARSAICRIVTGAVMVCRVEARAGCVPQRYRPLPTRLLRVYYATESDSPGAVHTGGHQRSHTGSATLDRVLAAMAQRGDF